MFGQNKKEEQDVIELGRSIIREADLEIPITYNGEVFTLKYPTPAMQAAIESEIARRLNGFPRSSFTNEHLTAIEAYVIIDLTYIPEKSPSWFKGPWTCYDEDLITTLYKGYFLFRNEFQSKLRNGRFEKGSQGVRD